MPHDKNFKGYIRRTSKNLVIPVYFTRKQVLINKGQ